MTIHRSKGLRYMILKGVPENKKFNFDLPDDPIFDDLKSFTIYDAMHEILYNMARQRERTRS